LKDFNGCRWTNRDARFGEKDSENIFKAFIETHLKPTIVEWCLFLLQYRNKTTKNLNEKVPLSHEMLKWDYADSIKRCQDGIGYNIDIHSDMWKKVITMIVYVNGKGSGTTLWDTNKKQSYHIRKPPNSALIFVPMQGITLHSVEMNEVTDRQTIQMTLIKQI